tara:strand:+ start:3142 stop:3459 length:318 start_codon:yes stop_codon:yes gene_type:complete
MNTLGIDFAIDLNESIEDMPSTLVFGAVSVTGTRSEWQRDIDAAAEGILEAETCLWIGKFADLTTMPTVNQVVAVDGTNATIIGKVEGSESAVIKFELRRLATLA